jgi:hypothetical protein
MLTTTTAEVEAVLFHAMIPEVRPGVMFEVIDNVLERLGLL